MKFHINPTTGNAGACGAQAGRCPFGSDEAHYSTAEAAREAYEAMMVAGVDAGFGDATPDPQVKRGAPMNTYNVEEGQRFTDEDGYAYEVTGVIRPGTYGIAESAGPGVKLTRLREDGSLSGYSRTVQHGGYYQPAQYHRVEEA